MEQVYFIFHPKTGRIKIGYTKKLNDRLVDIANGLADPVSLLGHIDGGRQLEQFIHKALHRFRLSGEWFKDCPQVRSLIEHIIAQGAEKAIAYVEPEPPKLAPPSEPDAAKFKRVCQAIWPRKTAAHLAAATGVTERAATHWLSGRCAPPARALAAIINEIVS